MLLKSKEPTHSREFEIDLYRICNQDKACDGEPAATSYSMQTTAHSSRFPTVTVEGLVVSDDGNIKLVNEYDSEWSDLGDDEDPDSNDERFHGNDYPGQYR